MSKSISYVNKKLHSRDILHIAASHSELVIDSKALKRIKRSWNKFKDESQFPFHQTLQKIFESFAVEGDVPLSRFQSRTALLCIIQQIIGGDTGVSPEITLTLSVLINKDCVPFIPVECKLIPSVLAHVLLCIRGKGKLWNGATSKWEESSKVMLENKISPLSLEPTECLPFMRIIIAPEMSALIHHGEGLASKLKISPNSTPVEKKVEETLLLNSSSEIPAS